jgi:hypothetical protein
MPYIKQDDRVRMLNDPFDAKTAGDLNYIFTMLIKNYMVRKGENYQNYNDAIGALEGCKLELYRRMISEYEDKKIIENGDLT